MVSPDKKPASRLLKATGAVLAILLTLLGFAMQDAWTDFGTTPEGTRLERIQTSSQFENGRFTNRMPMKEPESTLGLFWKFFFSPKDTRIPKASLPVQTLTAADFSVSPSGARITWFGHSSFLIEVDGVRLLVDPVWGKRASPFSFLGPKRFYEPPIALDELPEIDAVVLSHDHYDHLNEETIVALRDRIPLYVAPLGVGAHLEYWGVDADRIIELDWWETTTIGGVDLVSTPARHFSGRTFNDRDKTLWSGWAVLGSERRIYYSGDTGYFHGFKEIGERLGPFDLTLIESGAYNQDWPDVHLGPEQAVQAHVDVRGDIMMPVHWGLFDLAFHGWTEPVERVLASAESRGISVATPNPGGAIELPSWVPSRRWWPDVAWLTVDEYPVVSTGL